VPILRPFRGLRYDAAAVGDLSAVISPPYDVISPDEQARLLARHPRNSVRLDLPEVRPGDEAGAQYRRAAADFVAWRTDGTLRKEPAAAIYAYEQAYRLPGQAAAVQLRTQRGFFARLKLEPFEPRGGVLPHERTLGGPKEDRYRLLRATGANFSPIIGLYRSGARSAELLDRLMGGNPEIEVVDDDGVGHRLWVASTADPERREIVRELLDLAGRGPVTLADGHHRYETALRYRDERAAARACPEDPPYEFVFSLMFDTAGTNLLVLPTHRLVTGEPAGEGLLEAAGRFFRVERLPSAAELQAAFAEPRARSLGDRAGQRIGLYSRGVAAILHPNPAALAPLLDPAASEVLRWLDVSVLAAGLEALLGVDRAATAGGRLSYTKDVGEGISAVDSGAADSAFLLDATPVAAVAAVAEAGELMPQKSTYFYPKPATGLMISPGEW
jgi:uncharacterized protein (DUF1015 family)